MSPQQHVLSNFDVGMSIHAGYREDRGDFDVSMYVSAAAYRTQGRMRPRMYVIKGEHVTQVHAGHKKAFGCLQQQTCTPKSPKWPTLSPSVMQIALMRLSGQFFKIWYTIPAASMCCQLEPKQGLPCAREAKAHD